MGVGGGYEKREVAVMEEVFSPAFKRRENLLKVFILSQAAKWELRLLYYFKS